MLLLLIKMSGFDDDFGEMVGGKEERTEDVTEDPAAEFLAREQEQLGELETELAPLSGWYHPPPTMGIWGNIGAFGVKGFLGIPIFNILWNNIQCIYIIQCTTTTYMLL